MYSPTKIKVLRERHSRYASWALWSVHDQRDVSIIEERAHEWHSRYVFIGLNISHPVKKRWGNFHVRNNGRAGQHDRKLKYACTPVPLRGLYLTDLFKNISAVNGRDLQAIVRAQSKRLQKNVDCFKQEMQDIQVTNKTVFVVFGDLTQKYFDNHFRAALPWVSQENVVYYTHWAARGTDQEWVEGLWGKLKLRPRPDYLGIDQQYHP